MRSNDSLEEFAVKGTNKELSYGGKRIGITLCWAPSVAPPYLLSTLFYLIYAQETSAWGTPYKFPEPRLLATGEKEQIM